MTKVTLRFELLAPLDERLMNNISRSGSLYGLLRVQLTPKMDGLVVDFDASRLTIHEVEHALGKAGIPVKRILTTA